MTRTPRRSRVALFAAALTLLGAPVAAAGTASAATWSHRDTRGDVIKVGLDGDKPSATKVPRDAATDITRFTVKHAPRKVVLTLKLRDLKGGDSFVAARLVTPREDYELMLLRSSDVRVFSLSTSGDADDVPCRGKRQSFDTKRDTITLTLPRTCLGKPAWVRAGAGYLRGDLLNDEDQTYTVDEALRRGTKAAAISDASLKVGPKVRVG